MATKFYRYSVSNEELPQVMAEVDAQGLIVRTFSDGERTHIYVASEKPAPASRVEPAEILEVELRELG
jgi:hypothetical protein